MGDLTVFEDAVSLLFPSLDLLNTSSRILIQRNIEFLDQFRIFGFDEERIVLCIVLAGLCAVICKVFDLFKTNHVVMFLCCIHLCCSSADLRIQIIAVLILDVQQPCHMVDTRNGLHTAFQLVLHIQLFKQLL